MACRRARSRPRGRLLSARSVLVEPRAALAAEPAGGDQLTHALRHLLTERLADRRGNVEADEVEQGEWAHRVPRAQLHALVDGLRLEPMQLDEPHGGEEVREEQPV